MFSTISRGAGLRPAHDRPEACRHTDFLLITANRIFGTSSILGEYSTRISCGGNDTTTMARKSKTDGGDMLQGTLDMLVLKILLLGPAHGHTIAHVIEKSSDEVLQVEHGS